MNINRVYKLVDTCAAEFKAKTPYYYSTFESQLKVKGKKAYSDNESIVSDKKKIIVLGSDQIESVKELNLIIAVFMVF